MQASKMCMCVCVNMQAYIIYYINNKYYLFSIFERYTTQHLRYGKRTSKLYRKSI
jgi:hypothetical protein